MKYLLENWSLIEEKSKDKKVCLFLDYDGTLSPIAAKPADAVLSENTRRRLEMLSLNGRCSIVIISGRGINDLMKVVNVPDIWYTGNHGLEFVTEKVNRTLPVSEEFFIQLAEVKKALEAGIKMFEGVFVEDKRMTLSIHFRLMKEEDLESFFVFINQLKADYTSGNVLSFREGKKVIEIRPDVQWNKGSAVLQLLEQMEFSEKTHLPIYFGDDKTDEDAFKVLKNKGITVHVGGNKDSAADYFVTDEEEVSNFLFLLNQHLYRVYAE